MLGRIWKRWKVIAHKIGNFQSRVLLNVFYFLILAPFALAVRMFSDPLRIRKPSRSHWLAKEGTAATGRDQARRQF
jgi:hypothetical protein